jgi:hypothetical protein
MAKNTLARFLLGRLSSFGRLFNPNLNNSFIKEIFLVSNSTKACSYFPYNPLSKLDKKDSENLIRKVVFVYCY